MSTITKAQVKPRNEEEVNALFPQRYLVKYTIKMGSRDQACVDEYLGRGPGLEKKVETHWRRGQALPLATGDVTFKTVEDAGLNA